MTAMTREAAFWAFFRFRIFVPLFEKNQAAENESLRLIHYISLYSPLYSIRTNVQLPSAEHERNSSAAPPPSFLQPVSSLPSGNIRISSASLIPNCFVQNGNRANPFPRRSPLYPYVLFCIFLLFFLLQFHQRSRIIVTE